MTPPGRLPTAAPESRPKKNAENVNQFTEEDPPETRECITFEYLSGDLRIGSFL